MTDIVVTAAQVAMLDPIKCITRSYLAGVAITKGQAVYIYTDGTVKLCDANGSGTYQFRGIALNTVGIGQAVEVLHEGEVGGFTVAGMNADAVVYVSNTAGALATAAGTTDIVAGRVVCLTNGPTSTKVVRITTQWATIWA